MLRMGGARALIGLLGHCCPPGSGLLQRAGCGGLQRRQQRQRRSLAGTTQARDLLCAVRGLFTSILTPHARRMPWGRGADISAVGCWSWSWCASSSVVVWCSHFELARAQASAPKLMREALPSPSATSQAKGGAIGRCKCETQESNVWCVRYVHTDLPGQMLPEPCCWG